MEVLPEEVLTAAISFLQDDPGSLHALTLVSRDFNRISLRYLVRHIDFTIRKPDYSSSRSFELFTRSLHENEKIASYVQTVKLQWSTGARITKEDRRTQAQANDLLKKLPNVRTLALKVLGPLPMAFDHEFLDANPLPLLQELNVWDFNTTATHIAKYIVTTPVQRMNVGCLNVHTPLGRKVTDISPSHISKLSNLRLGNFHLPISTLSDLLGLTEALKVLTCVIPRDEEPRTGPLRTSMRWALSPAAVARALEPVKDTLVELSLGDHMLTSWPSHDNSRMDLSDFIALRRLSIASSCVFPLPTPERKEREGLWRLLPRGIENINVRHLARV